MRLLSTLILLFSISNCYCYPNETIECSDFKIISTETTEKFLGIQQKFAHSQSISKEKWERSLFTDKEEEDLKKLIHQLLLAKNFDGFSDNLLKQYDTLNFLTLTFMQGKSVAIIHEEDNEAKILPRLFGFLAIRAVNHVKNNIHYSSPHFETDGAVSVQASNMFEKTLGRSLVISGGARDCVMGKFTSVCQKTTKLADVAHNADSNFHKIMVGIYEVIKGDEEDYHFIQFHGMAESSCKQSRAFMSIGAKGGSPVYNDTKALVYKLHESLNSLIPSFCNTPANDDGCNLVAATNVFGRLVNGVKIGSECKTKANFTEVNGHFIHIEQKIESRCNTTLWETALLTALKNDASPSFSKYFILTVLSFFTTFLLYY